MNIIWLTPEVPFPPIGGRNGVYNRIVQLSKCNDIFLFSIAYNETEKADIHEMEKYCREVHFYNRNDSKLLTLIKCILYPFSVASRYRKDICDDIKSLVLKKKIDVIIVDFPNMAINVRNIWKHNKKITITINEHNVEYIRMRSMKNIASIPLTKRLAYFCESYRLEQYERKLYKSNIFKGISFFSEDDRNFFENNIDTASAILKTIPLGANNYHVESGFKGTKTLLFVGRLDHIAIPNVEAVHWFVSNIWPSVLNVVPNAKLIIAGSNPEEDILKLNSESITIIPNFKNMKELYDKTDCVILPLLSGGGVKGKLLEALAMRKHIITTDHGIEGTDFKDIEHVSLANDEEKFAFACIDFLENPEKYKEQEFRAYSLFKDKYDWCAIGRVYNKFINNLCKGSK